jgi:hypothetical protein
MANYPTFVESFFFIFIALLIFGYWYHLTSNVRMTQNQYILTTIYLFLFVFIVKDLKILFTTLAVISLVLAIHIYIRSIYRMNEGFEMAKQTGETTKEEKKEETNENTNENTKQTNAKNKKEGTNEGMGNENEKKEKREIIPVTDVKNEKGEVHEVDEWTEDEKKKVQGIYSLNKKDKERTLEGMNELEEQAEKERTGITFTPAAAQRETYKLIDAVQQLQEVMTTLSPSLIEGKKVIDMFEKINMIK